MSVKYNKLAMSWNVAIVKNEKVLAIILGNGGEFAYRRQSGRGVLALVDFPDSEKTQACLEALEKLEMHAELFVEMKVRLN